MKPARAPWSTVPRLLAACAAGVLLAAMLPFHATAGQTMGARGGPGVPYARGRVIVGFEPGASRLARGVAVASVEPRSVRRASPLAKDTVVVRLAPGQSVEAAIEEIGARPGVAYVEPDYKLYVAETPDEERYLNGQHWGMYGDATTPANPFGSGAGEAWAAGHVGDPDILVGVIDVGLQVDHPDLLPNVWENPFDPVNGLDDDGNGYVDDINGWDFYGDDASVYDGSVDDHGTHVAGTIGARGGNGIGVAGVNWRVGLISAKFIGPEVGFISDAVDAIDYITDLKLRHDLPIVATNNSWTGGEYSHALLAAIERAGDAGILFVAAAGNLSTNIDQWPAYPASYRCTRRADGTARGWDCLVSVANIDEFGGLNSTSNRGLKSVDLGAPGTRIVSTVANDGYAYYSGTSMAAPHVSGALALCASLAPTFSPRQLRSLLMHKTTPTASLSGRTATGGRLDIGTLAERCASGEAPPPATVRIDELEPGFTRSGRGWRNVWTGYGGHHFWLPTRDGVRQSYGTWRPRLERGGSYKILARIPAQTELSRKATYRIRTSSGWVERTRNQAKNRGSWMKLGIFRLTSSPTVRLTDATGEGGAGTRRLVFDALRLVPTTAAVRTASRERTPAEGGDPRAESVPSLPEPGLEPGPSAVPPGTSEPQPTPEPPTPAPADGGEPSVPERRPVEPTPEPRASDTPATPAPQPDPSGLPAPPPGDVPGEA